jgi:hypothetical protein
MTDLDTITQDFGLAYAGAKNSTTFKDSVQKAMFAAFTEAAKSGALAQRLIDNLSDLPNADYVERNFPGWRLVSTTQRDPRKIMIEEDPAYVKYTYINRIDGMVYGRTVAESGMSLDDVALREANPDLWKSISYWPEPLEDILTDIVDRFAGFPAESTELVEQILQDFGIDRHIRPPGEWTSEQTEAVGDYMVPGKLTVRLITPRKATEEELGE